MTIYKASVKEYYRTGSRKRSLNVCRQGNPCHDVKKVNFKS